MRALVTGGAGYIWPHQCQLPVERRIEPTAIDGLSTGVREQVAGLKLYGVDLTGPDAPTRISEILRNTLTDSFVHLAASKRIDASQLQPVPELDDTTAMNLTPMAIAGAMPGKASLNYGSDHPTDDGTCVSDDVHVPDLSDAQLAALASIGRQRQPHRVYNVSTDRGVNGADVIDRIRHRLPGSATPIIGTRRPTDAAVVVADLGRIGRELQWTSQRGLTEIIDSAVAAHRRGTTGGEDGQGLP